MVTDFLSRSHQIAIPFAEMRHWLHPLPCPDQVPWRVAQVFGSKLHHQSWVPQVLAVEDLGYHDHRLHLLSFAIRITMKKMPRFLCPLVPVSLRKFNALSYRPTPSDNLHAINPEYALLIMSRKSHGPNPHGFGPFQLPLLSLTLPSSAAQGSKKDAFWTHLNQV